VSNASLHSRILHGIRGNRQAHRYEQHNGKEG
jgi:hypothetical protein